MGFSEFFTERAVLTAACGEVASVKLKAERTVTAIRHSPSVCLLVASRRQLPARLLLVSTARASSRLCLRGDTGTALWPHSGHLCAWLP